MTSTLCEWYDVKVRGILGSGRRDVQDIEILGRTLRQTEQGLQHEAGGKHRQALLQGLGLNEDSKSVNSEAMKEEEELSQEEDEKFLEAEEESVQKFGGDVELHELGQMRCAMRGEGGVPGK